MVAAIARIKHKGILRNYDAFGVFLLSRLNQSKYSGSCMITTTTGHVFWR